MITIQKYWYNYFKKFAILLQSISLILFNQTQLNILESTFKKIAWVLVLQIAVYSNEVLIEQKVDKI